MIDRWGDVALPVNVRSARKSLLNALAGIAVDEGRLKTSATLADLDIDDLQPLTDEEKRATVADLLTSRSGVYHPAAYEARGAGNLRPARGTHPHGTHFYYNNWDFNALGTIVAKAFGRSVFDVFAERIAGPLGMQDFSLARTENRLEPMSRHPAYLFRMSARDLARFGLLFLHDGEWGGARIVSREWVRVSSTGHVRDARNDTRYGYLWWVAPEDDEPGFFAAGNGGQFVLVVPGRQLVVSHVVENDNLIERRAQRLDVTWREFFAMMRLIAAAAPKPR